MGSLSLFAFLFLFARGVVCFFVYMDRYFVPLYTFVVLLHSCRRPQHGLLFFLLLMFASCNTLCPAGLAWSTIDATAIGVSFCQYIVSILFPSSFFCFAQQHLFGDWDWMDWTRGTVTGRWGWI